MNVTVDNSSVEAAMGAFPRLAFFLPTVPPHDVRIGDTTYHVREHIIGILWLADEIEREDGVCRLKDLRRVFNHWWPAESKASPASNLAHYLGELIDLKLVTEAVDSSDRRRHLLRLTENGRALLAHAKTQRSRLIQKLLAQLPPPLLAQTLEVARDVGTIAWRMIRSPLKV